MICILYLIVDDLNLLLGYPSAGEGEYERNSVLNQSKPRISSSLRAISESNIGDHVIKTISVFCLV